jgi:nucleoside-diphosphate-sugar epimerase
MRILLTGHLGYLGSAMAARLAAAGHRVTGLDTGYFENCLFVEPLPGVSAEVRRDLRDLTARDLQGYEAVVHLAALSNDPLGNLNEEWTQAINHRASVRLAELARAAGVERFLFSSSCIMYGAASAAEVNEDSPLDPRTAYARSKVEAERGIAALASPGFSPVFLRNGTVYGISPRMRFDTVLNNLTGEAVSTGRVTVQGDGSPWRPVVHIDDVAAVFLAALAAPRARLHNQAINAAAAGVNHRVIDLARAVVRAVPGARLECLGQPGADRRTYKANFDKIARLLPEFELRWSIEAGIAQLVDAFTRRGLTEADFTSPRFTRLAWLDRLIGSGEVDSELRLRQPAAVEAPV